MSFPAEKYLEIAHQLQEMEKRNRVFWNLFGNALKKLNYCIDKNKDTIILSIGCGSCEEARVVCSFFSSGTYNFPTSRAKLIGIDRDEGALEQARKLISIPPVTAKSGHFVIEPNCEFYSGDARDLSQFPQLPKFVDIVMYRHHFTLSDLQQEKSNWIKMIEQGTKKVSPEGLLIFTSYREEEHTALEAVLKTLNVNILLSEKNPDAISINDPKYPTVCYDKLITIAKK